MESTFPDLLGMTFDEIKAQQIADQAANYIPKEEDNGEPRPYWVADYCPAFSDCSLMAFKHAKCWSYSSEQDCRLYVAKHMYCSGNHEFGAEAALEAANHAVVVQMQETMAERDQIRKYWDKQQARPMIGSAAQAPLPRPVSIKRRPVIGLPLGKPSSLHGVRK